MSEEVANPCGICGRDAKKDWLLCRGHFVADIKQLKAETERLKARVKEERRTEGELRSALKGLLTAFHGAWVDHGYSAESLGDEYREAVAALESEVTK
jgi:hypothetical protein